jgi:4-amino-4-deoxy-L-arabinose transferase-like glycosyltransferase
MDSAAVDARIRLASNARARSAVLAGAVVLLVAQQALLWWLYYHGGGKQLMGDEVQYLDTARAILAGGPWHPSDLWPPAQPLLIAAILAVGGGSVLAVQLVQTLLFLGCGVLIARLARHLSGSVAASVVATLLFVLNPSNAAYAHYLWPEIPHLFAVLLALDLLLVRRTNRVTAFAAGASIGLALLFKSLLAAFWPLLLLCFVAWKPVQVRWREAGLFVLGVGIAIAPALIAGHRNTGHWSIADSSAINLLIGLEDTARNDYVVGPSAEVFPNYARSGTTPDERNAWAWQQIREKVSNTPLATLLLGQLDRQYFRLFESKTLLLTQLPGPACAGYRGNYAATPAAVIAITRWSAHLMHALTLAGFAFGVFLWRRWNFAAWLLLAFVAYQLALYAGLHVQARYLLPMMPVLCVFAGNALARIGASSPEQTRATRTRFAFGAALATLLLWLAFAGPFLDGYCRA